MESIYHITNPKAWEQAGKTGEYRAASLETEGFIHCSKWEQLLPVAGRFYSGQTNLLILVIDPTQLTADLRWEPGSDKADELFPHIHGPLNLDAVLRTAHFTLTPDGHFRLPER